MKPAAASPALTPRLRFPEFRKAPGWDACPLQEIAEFVGDRVSVAELNRADYVSTENLLPDFGGFSLPSSFPAGGSVVRYRANDILAANIRPYLKKIWLADRNGGASNDVLVIRAQTSINHQYLSYVLKNDRFVAYVMSGAKGLKMPRGDVSLIREYPVPTPSLLEQHRIASCLSSLDDLIAAERQKLDALKAHKKGLMQQLFPREGETRPRLRFPEFRNAPGWEACALEELAEFIGDRVLVSELNRADYVSTENLLPDFGGFSLPSSFPTGGSVVRYRANDILAANIRPYLKKIWVADRNGGASNDVIVIRASRSADHLYLSHVLKNDRFIGYVMSGAKGLKMPRGDVSLIREYPVPTPSPPEQHKIAACLTSLDDLIAAQAAKLEALKTHKKGLMQQLFPAPEEVEA